MTKEQKAVRDWARGRDRNQRSWSVSWFMKLRNKLSHMVKRAIIAVTSIYLKKYRKETPLDLAQVKSILIIPNQPIGDLLVSSPLWHALKHRKPDLKIGVAISPRNQAVLLGDKDVDETYMLYAHSRWTRFREMMRARKDGWDVVLSTAGFFRTGRQAFLARVIAKAGVTVTSHPDRYERFHNLYSFCFPRRCQPYPVPVVEQIQEIAEKTFAIEFANEECKPQFTPTPEAIKTIQARLSELFAKSHTSHLIFINLEAQRPGLEWGIANALEFSRIVTEKNPDVLVLFTATMNYVNYFWNDMQHLFTAAEDGTGHHEKIQFFKMRDVHEIGALVSLSDLVISPDTSVSHLSAILGVPILGLYGFRNEWIPYTTKRVVLPANPSQFYATKSVSTIPMEDVFAAAHTLAQNLV
jgi:ADP-heptose:LPS heptosyltransferase